MLQDRVIATVDSFIVKADQEDREREVLYGFFTLAQDPENVPLKFGTDYWQPGRSNEKYLPGNIKEAFVRVVEKKEGKIVDEATVFLARNVQKPTLWLSIESARRYGSGAFLYTVSWGEGAGEKIYPSHIFVQQKNNKGEVYPFLVDFIEVRKTVRGENIDQYVFYIPNGDDEENYHAGCSDILKMKYRVMID